MKVNFPFVRAAITSPDSLSIIFNSMAENNSACHILGSCKKHIGGDLCNLSSQERELTWFSYTRSWKCGFVVEYFSDKLFLFEFWSAAFYRAAPNYLFGAA